MEFVGRKRELAQLAGALQRASSGRAGVVTITASAGMGVTRLIDEFTRRLAAVPDVLVVRGTAIEPAAGEPYQPLVDGLRRAFEELSDSRLRVAVGRSGSDLAMLVPELADRLDRLGVDRSPHRLVAPDQVGSRVLETIIGLLERLAGTGVLLLAMEDLHRSDPATRGLVTAWLRVRRSMPACLLLTWQPDELTRRHPWRTVAETLGDDPGIEHIHLMPLDAMAEELLVADLEDRRPDSDRLAAIHVGAAGNPLLVRHLAMAGRSVAGVRLSDSFEDSVSAMLEALSTSGRALVRLLAGARQPLPRARIAGTVVAGSRITATTISEVVEAGLVVAGADGLAIIHELHAEAVEALESPDARSQLHATIAGLLDASPARAAWHWAVAGRARHALEAHRRAVAVCSTIDPGETTLTHHLRILELSSLASAAVAEASTGADPTRSLVRSPGDQAATLAGAARASAAAGSFRRAAGFLRRAIRAYDEEHQETEREERRVVVGTLHEELGRMLWASGDLAAGIAAMEHALAVLPGDPTVARAHALAALAQHLMLDGRFEDSAALAAQAREIAEDVGTDAESERAHALCTLGVDLAWQGALDRGLALVRESASVARRAGRLDDLMRAALNRTTLLDLDARREQALAVVTTGIRDAQAGGLGRTYGAFLRGNAADILYQLGRWPESEAECRAGMEWQPTGVAWFSPRLYLGLVLVESRADDEAAEIVGQTQLELDTVPAGQWTALVQRAAVSLALWQGDHADALTIARRAWPRVLETGDEAQIALAASTCLEAAAAAAEDGRARRDVGLVSAATDLSSLVLDEATRRVASGSLVPGLGARVEADLHLATARAHRRRVQGRASAATWARLADAWADRGIPYQTAKARWWQALAELRGRGNDRSAAREPLREAWRLASRLPAAPLCEAIADLATRARLPLPIDEGYPAPPTSRRRPTRAVAGRVPVPVVADRGREPEEVRGPIVDVVRAPERGAAPFGLSRRELEVLLIICEGRTDREIAERLFISERTVHVHVRKVLHKMGVASRTRAATLAWQAGVVPSTSGAMSR